MMECIGACDCNDMTCLQKCPEPSGACGSCLEKIATCTEQCEEPACMTEQPSNGQKCTDLADCCAAMEADDDRTACEQALELADGNEVSCGALYDAQCK